MSKHYPKFSDLYLGEVINLRRYANPKDESWSCFNPSIAYSPKYGYAIAFRSSNYEIMSDSGELHVRTNGPVKNKVFFSETNEKFELLKFRQISFAESGYTITRGVEDVKLFWRNNKWNFTGVFLERDVPIARMCTGILDPAKNEAYDLELYGSMNPKRPEKNWAAPNEPNPNFDFIHSPTSVVKDRQIIFRMTDNPDIAALRGNTNLLTLKDGNYLALNHILYTTPTRTYDPRIFGVREGLQKNYTHVFVKYNQKGELIKIGEEFQFIGPGIEFAAGLVEMGENLVVSFGRGDVSSHIATMPKSHVLAQLKSV